MVSMRASVRREAVEEGARATRPRGPLEIGAVGVEDGAGLLFESRAICVRASFFGAGGAEGQRAGGRPARPAPSSRPASSASMSALRPAPRGSPGCPGGSPRRSSCTPGACSISRVLAPRIRRTSGASKFTRPRANSRSPSTCPATATTAPAAKSPSTPTTPGG